MHNTFVIGNPGNRRLAYFEAAVLATGHPKPRIISWRDICQDLTVLPHLLREADLIRLESPGEDAHVERALIALGAAEEHGFLSIDRDAALALPQNHGQILYLHQWYLGFARALRQIAAAAPPAALFFNHPDAVIQLFDKFACQQILSKSRIPSPPLLGSLLDYPQLRSLMEERAATRVFLKPAGGSSASGVMALHAQGSRVSAYSSILARAGLRDMTLFNSLKLQNYRNETELAAVVNALARHRCLVETWLPKAQLEREVFDVRVVVIAGKAAQRVVRLSRKPMTNLHLGNRRGDWSAVVNKFGLESSEALLHTAERAAATFPHAVCLGVDVLMRARDHQPFIVELNAFGDLLPGITHEGQNTYEATYAAMCRKLVERKY